MTDGQSCVLIQNWQNWGMCTVLLAHCSWTWFQKTSALSSANSFTYHTSSQPSPRVLPSRRPRDTPTHWSFLVLLPETQMAKPSSSAHTIQMPLPAGWEPTPPATTGLSPSAAPHSYQHILSHHRARRDQQACWRGCLWQLRDTGDFKPPSISVQSQTRGKNKEKLERIIFEQKNLKSCFNTWQSRVREWGVYTICSNSALSLVPCTLRTRSGSSCYRNEWHLGSDVTY